MSKQLLFHFLKCMRSWSTSFKMEGVLILTDCVSKHLSYGHHKRNLCTGNFYRHLLVVLGRIELSNAQYYCKPFQKNNFHDVSHNANCWPEDQKLFEVVHIKKYLIGSYSFIFILIVLGDHRDLHNLGHSIKCDFETDLTLLLGGNNTNRSCTE